MSTFYGHQSRQVYCNSQDLVGSIVPVSLIDVMSTLRWKRPGPSIIREVATPLVKLIIGPDEHTLQACTMPCNVDPSVVHPLHQKLPKSVSVEIATHRHPRRESTWELSLG